ncbi:MAG: hypothetical protein ACYDA3_09135 [Gaiellaceae bacterium]
MLGFSLWLLTPLWVLLGLVLLFGVFALLARIKGGRYLRPLFAFLARVPLLKRWLQKASDAALERSNPELASAMKKVQRFGGTGRDPVKAQQAMSRLTAQERRALLDMQEQQGLEPEALSREQRRRLERAKRRRR